MLVGFKSIERLDVFALGLDSNCSSILTFVASVSWTVNAELSDSVVESSNIILRLTQLELSCVLSTISAHFSGRTVTMSCTEQINSLNFIWLGPVVVNSVGCWKN